MLKTALFNCKASSPLLDRIDMHAVPEQELLDKSGGESSAPDAQDEKLLRHAVARGPSARAYHRVLKVARTIADLDGSPGIQSRHIAEAVQYRRLDL